jgi:hypothetical protein
LEVKVGANASIEQELNTTKPGAVALVAVATWYGGQAFLPVVEKAGEGVIALVMYLAEKSGQAAR